MSLTLPVAETARSPDLCDNCSIAVNKGQKENISTLRLALRIGHSCGRKPRQLNTRWPLKRWKDGKTDASCSASAVPF